ncbi:MAG: hypothetical protein Q8K38_00035 [Burkholderiaceae bacterium]|nr:hypothetical protein [Burkholderiaceae bacterium]MDZ4146002.1 hypothetical protein [Burkholderiales bacterium]
MNTLKALSLAALLGTSLVSHLAAAEDHFGGFATGAMVRVDGITRPAPAHRQVAPESRLSSAPAAPERLLGGLVRDARGRVMPIDGRTTLAVGTGDRPALSTASLGTPVDERLLGSFVRHNGIAVPATPNEQVATRVQTPGPQAAAHPAR